MRLLEDLQKEHSERVSALFNTNQSICPEEADFAMDELRELENRIKWHEDYLPGCVEFRVI